MKSYSPCWILYRLDYRQQDILTRDLLILSTWLAVGRHSALSTASLCLLNEGIIEDSSHLLG